MPMNLLENPRHPGEVLNELYLKPLNMGAVACSHRLGVPGTLIERIVKGQANMTSDTALRLARLFSTTPTYWVNLQTNSDMAKASRRVDLSIMEPLPRA